jgi:hypothetical protein
MLQLDKQKFLRQVIYEKPKDLEDPSKITTKDDEESSSLDIDTFNTYSLSEAKSSAHVNRVRAYRRPGLDSGLKSSAKKSGKSSGALGSASRQHGKNKPTAEGAKNQMSGGVTEVGRRAIESEGSGTEDYGEEGFEDMDGDGDGDADGDEVSDLRTADTERKSELASVQREIRIGAEDVDYELLLASFQGGEPAFNGVPVVAGRPFYMMPAEVTCWLLSDSSTLVITAITVGGCPTLEAEAEVTAEELAAAKGMDASSLVDDLYKLAATARELVASVEIRLENDGAAGDGGYDHRGINTRLVLNLSVRPSVQGRSAESIETAIAEFAESLVASRASDEEVNKMLISKSQLAARLVVEM